MSWASCIQIQGQHVITFFFGKDCFTTAVAAFKPLRFTPKRCRPGSHGCISPGNNPRGFVCIFSVTSKEALVSI